MSMSLTDVVFRADWEELRMQKRWLVEQNTDEAEGLLNFIDHIQDAVVDSGLVPEHVVFGEISDA